MKNYLSITNSRNATGGNARNSNGKSPCSLKTDKTMKRDNKSLQWAIDNGYKYVLATPTGEIVGYGLSRSPLERWLHEHKSDNSIYTIRQYQKLTE